MNVAAAGVDADFADDRQGLVAQALVFAIGEGLRWRHRDRITGVNPHGVEVFDAADDHHVVGGVAHHLQLKLLPAQQRLFNQDLINGAGFQAAVAQGPKFLGVVGNAAARAAQGEGRANDARVTADLIANRFGLLHGGGNSRWTHRHTDAFHGLFEQVAVFGFLNGGQIGANQLHAMALEGAVFGQAHRQVQSGLAAHGGQQGIGLLQLDHAPHHIGCQRLDVGPIRHFWIGHDRGGVGVHQHHLKAISPQGFAGLSAGIIKFAGLADHNRPRSQQQNAAKVRATGHGPALTQNILSFSSPRRASASGRYAEG